MTPTTYGRDFAYCLKSHGGVRGFNASLWRFLLRCTLFCHSVATFLTSVSSYEGGCGFEVYEYKKGVRRLVLYTFNKKYESFAITRLERQNIDYIIQPVGNDRLNLFFGKKECLDAIRMIITKPLCQLTPEEDFILGAMLGYDICAQCERYCERKKKVC